MTRSRCTLLGSVALAGLAATALEAVGKFRDQMKIDLARDKAAAEGAFR